MHPYMKRNLRTLPHSPFYSPTTPQAWAAVCRVAWAVCRVVWAAWAAWVAWAVWVARPTTMRTTSVTTARTWTTSRTSTKSRLSPDFASSLPQVCPDFASTKRRTGGRTDGRTDRTGVELTESSGAMHERRCVPAARGGRVRYTALRAGPRGRHAWVSFLAAHSKSGA